MIGGASLFGGVGTIFGTFVGVCLISSLVTGLILANVQPFWQTVVTGVVIIGAVYIDQLRDRLRFGGEELTRGAARDGGQLNEKRGKDDVERLVPTVLSSGPRRQDRGPLASAEKLTCAQDRRSRRASRGSHHRRLARDCAGRARILDHPRDGQGDRRLSGILAHYFEDKDDILTYALKISHRRIRERQNDKLNGLTGLEALKALVLDNLPLDEERELETRLEISYWARSLTRAEVTKVQRAEAAILHKRMATLVFEAQDLGEIEKNQSPEMIVERLHALIDGLSLHALIHRERVSKETQTAIIDQEFAGLAASHRRKRATPRRRS